MKPPNPNKSRQPMLALLAGGSGCMETEEDKISIPIVLEGGPELSGCYTNHKLKSSHKLLINPWRAWSHAQRGLH